MTHKFTIDSFTQALQGKNPEFDAALESQKGIEEMFKFVDQLLDNTVAAPDPRPRARKVAPPKRKIRRGVGSY